MSIAIKFLWFILGLGLLLGLISLATWGIPAPSGEVKITIPNDRFYKKVEPADPKPDDPKNGQ